MSQNKNNKIPLTMKTPPMRISLCVLDHPVDISNPAFKLMKGIDELAATVQSIVKKAGVK